MLLKRILGGKKLRNPKPPFSKWMLSITCVTPESLNTDNLTLRK